MIRNLLLRSAITGLAGMQRARLRVGYSLSKGRIRTEREPRLYAFGSSACEILDYVFGPSERYRSHWASGWSARGFRKPGNRAYVLKCLSQAEAQDIVFLHFGTADGIFNAAHRMDQGNFLNPEGFCQEAAEGIRLLVRDLQVVGITRVYAIFATPPVDLPPAYFRNRFSVPGIPSRYQAQLLKRINTLIGQVCAQRDLTPILADEFGVLLPEYHRSKPDHHPDYIRIQRKVWEALRDIEGVPPHRTPWLDAHYPHRPSSIVTKIREGDCHPNTLPQEGVTAVGK